jgi:hypothetical protein
LMVRHPKTLHGTSKYAAEAADGYVRDHSVNGIEQKSEDALVRLRFLAAP